MEDKIRKKGNMGEREDILHDVKKLKDEIKEFQSKIMHEPYVKGYSNQEQEREAEMVWYLSL